MKYMYKYFIRSGILYSQTCEVKESEGKIFIRNIDPTAGNNCWTALDYKRGNTDKIILDTKDEEKAKQILREYYNKKLEVARKDVERFENIINEVL